MDSRASASSRAKACSSSYSPGRPRRSRMMRPVFAQPDTQKMKMTRAMRMMEPNEETRPMMTPVKADEGVELSPMMADGWGVSEGVRERVAGLCESVSYRPGRSGTGTGDVLVTGDRRQATGRDNRRQRGDKQRRTAVTAATEAFGRIQSRGRKGRTGGGAENQTTRR